MRRYPNIFGKISKYYQIFLHIVLILNIYKLTGTAWLAVSPDHLVVLVPGSSGTPESVRVLPGALVVRLVLVHEGEVAGETLDSPAASTGLSSAVSPLGVDVGVEMVDLCGTPELAAVHVGGALPVDGPVPLEGEDA